MLCILIRRIKQCLELENYLLLCQQVFTEFKDNVITVKKGS